MPSHHKSRHCSCRVVVENITLNQSKGHPVGVISPSYLLQSHPMGIITGQKSMLANKKPSKSQLRFSICRASSEIRSSADVVLPQEEAGQQVFKDESNGVVCYYDETGDVTCEGWDEGPHFQPDPQQPTLRRRRRFTQPSVVQGRRGVEAVSFENVKGRMGDSLGEVANESLESSEL